MARRQPSISSPSGGTAPEDPIGASRLEHLCGELRRGYNSVSGRTSIETLNPLIQDELYALAETFRMLLRLTAETPLGDVRERLFATKNWC
jgi:hypothetical protein